MLIKILRREAAFCKLHTQLPATFFVVLWNHSPERLSHNYRKLLQT